MLFHLLCGAIDAEKHKVDALLRNGGDQFP